MSRACWTSLIPHEAEVQTKTGAWYLMRIRPYRTLENVIDGAVLTFVDISERKRMEMALREAQMLAENIVDTVREPLLVLDEDLRVLSANRAFYDTFAVEEKTTLGHVIYDLGNRQWDIPELRQLLEVILPENTTFEDYHVTHTFEKIGSRTMVLNARRVFTEAGQAQLILLAIEDITGRH